MYVHLVTLEALKKVALFAILLLAAAVGALAALAFVNPEAFVQLVEAAQGKSTVGGCTWYYSWACYPWRSYYWWW